MWYGGLFEKSGQFTARSLYRFLSHGGGGVIRRRMKEIWRAKLPLKIRIFLWQMANDRLPTVEQLKKRNWEGKVECQLCGKKEGVDHIMFKCVLSKYVWAVVRDALGWERYPCSLEEFLIGWVNGKSAKLLRVMYFGLGAVCWALWKARNEMAIEKKVVKLSRVLIFNVIALMQQWRILVPEEERKLVEMAI
jgi:hypothetical protein